ncbi:hypothetical protein KM043_008722 [Ampulex compressa]|nr:hypothetical protein KM043_008722 [Ampulex compressa]
MLLLSFVCDIVAFLASTLVNRRPTNSRSTLASVSCLAFESISLVLNANAKANVSLQRALTRRGKYWSQRLPLLASGFSLSCTIESNASPRNLEARRVDECGAREIFSPCNANPRCQRTCGNIDKGDAIPCPRDVRFRPESTALPADHRLLPSTSPPATAFAFAGAIAVRRLGLPVQSRNPLESARSRPKNSAGFEGSRLLFARTDRFATRKAVEEAVANPRYVNAESRNRVRDVAMEK